MVQSFQKKIQKMDKTRANLNMSTNEWVAYVHIINQKLVIPHNNIDIIFG